MEIQEKDEITNDTEYFDFDPVLFTAQKTFGISYLYPWQRLVIASILEPSDNYGHQIVLLPTGAGKSLCFLVPALLLSGPTLILYPLLALMSDQARRMIEGGMEPVVFKGQQTEQERDENFKKLEQGAKVILANPEVLQSESLVKKLSQCGIAHIAIDEAHCVSEWGDTFRPAYLTLGKIINTLNVNRVTAFTATASPEVLDRVNEVLFNNDARVVRSESDRPNIHYYVHYAYVKDKAILELIEKEKKPLLVFCGTRKKTEQIAYMINEHYKSIHPEIKDCIRFYHAGLSKEEKTTIEKWFYPHKDAIMAVTNAFGMGVDKKDIKTVIHIDVPSTIEAFIQEAGRGGRDGSIGKSILIWSPEDTKKFANYEKGSRKRMMGDFAEAVTCRRQILLNALGGEQVACKGCDICLGVREETISEEDAAIKFIRKNRKLYSISEAATAFTSTNYLDYDDKKFLFEEVLKQEKIFKSKFFWKNKLYTPSFLLQLLRHPLNLH